ncbi:MAG: hypothetical protein EOP04_08850 [Proteobacteria bacterium]|nr:MAG: hypothetical protein EOP04_08850 [Pseudomonadota bacterium]
MNKINVIQNESRNLQLLAAQRQLYSEAKRAFGVYVIIFVPIAILLLAMNFIYPDLKPYSALLGIAVSFADIIWLTPFIKNKRALAARIQEEFDCSVLDLPIDTFKTGGGVDPELVLSKSEKYKGVAEKSPPLQNWYSPSVSEVPLTIARFICQRSNCWWDLEQRKSYINYMLIILVSTFVAAILLSLAMNLYLIDFVLVINTLMPLFVLGFRQRSEQLDSIIRLINLKNAIENGWAKILKNESKNEDEILCRMLQSEIYESRKRNPLVFDFIFKKLRNDFEERMNFGAEKYVEEAKRVLKL